MFHAFNQVNLLPVFCVQNFSQAVDQDSTMEIDDRQIFLLYNACEFVEKISNGRFHLTAHNNCSGGSVKLPFTSVHEMKEICGSELPQNHDFWQSNLHFQSICCLGLNVESVF